MAISTLFTGFGVNVLTGETPAIAGYSVFIPGVAALIAGLYFSLRDGEK
jgi:hypothetical protein